MKVHWKQGADAKQGESAFRSLLRNAIPAIRASGLSVEEIGTHKINLQVNKALKGGVLLIQPHDYEHYAVVLKGCAVMQGDDGTVKHVSQGDLIQVPRGVSYLADCLEDVEFVCIHPKA